MAAIKASFGSGGTGFTPGGASGSPSLATILRDIADDLTALRTAHNVLVAKLNLDGGVADTNYATIPSQLTSKA